MIDGDDLLALTGHAGAGKDTVAAILGQHGFQTLAFADALRIEVAAAWRIEPRTLSEPATKNIQVPALSIAMCTDERFVAWCDRAGVELYDARSPRWALQHWGSWRRSADPAYWLRPVQEWISYALRHGRARLCVSDLRMDNEATLVRSFGGRIVRVHRPDLPPLPAALARHESERHGRIEADYDIVNDSSLSALRGEVERMLDTMALGAARPAERMPLSFRGNAR